MIKLLSRYYHPESMIVRTIEGNNILVDIGRMP